MLWPLFDDQGSDRATHDGTPCVDNDRNWFWTVLPRWPDAHITNGPKVVTSAALTAYRGLCAAQQGRGLKLFCVLDVVVSARRILGAQIRTSSGNAILDELASRLYPRLVEDEETDCGEVFKVTVYAYPPKPENTFQFELE